MSEMESRDLVLQTVVKKNHYVTCTVEISPDPSMEYNGVMVNLF